jgi:hypothetical protein
MADPRGWQRRIIGKSHADSNNLTLVHSEKSDRLIHSAI